MLRSSRLVLALLAAGCASTTEISSPDDGQATYRIECPGPATAVRACLRKAHTLCPTGFSILEAQPPLGLSTAGPSHRGGLVRDRILVRCFWRDPQGSLGRPIPPVAASPNPVQAGASLRLGSIEGARIYGCRLAAPKACLPSYLAFRKRPVAEGSGPAR
jgi:hypothetical protein